MHTCLWPGAQKLFRHKWKKLVTAFFYIIVLTDIAALILGMSFSSVFLVSNWNLFVLPCHRTVCSWNPKLIWPRLGFFRRFCWNMPPFDDLISAWTKLCTNCFLTILFLTTSNFFDIWFEANSGLFFNYAWNFSFRILQFRLISSSIAMKIHFISFGVFQSGSPGSCDESILRILLKTN